jgi:hypothetical protein
MVLLISYDLNGHERPDAYDDVKKVITTNAIAYLKPLYSQWFVETSEGPGTWVERLTKVIDSDDQLFVVKVTKPYQGWLTKSEWEWLDARV